jgi:hypothetical protein
MGAEVVRERYPLPSLPPLVHLSFFLRRLEKKIVACKSSASLPPSLSLSLFLDLSISRSLDLDLDHPFIYIFISFLRCFCVSRRKASWLFYSAPFSLLSSVKLSLEAFLFSSLRFPLLSLASICFSICLSFPQAGDNMSAPFAFGSGGDAVLTVPQLSLEVYIVYNTSWLTPFWLCPSCTEFMNLNIPFYYHISKNR